MYEDDIDWLLKRKPDATEIQIEDFTERVAIAIADGRMDEDDARHLALRRVFAPGRVSR